MRGARTTKLLASIMVGAGLAFWTPPVAAANPGSPTAQRPPNIVFILVDDVGWADVAYNGSRFYETPNIDRLASEGMRFTNAYAAAPFCSPTRASIQTGKYPARLGITSWLRTPPTFRQAVRMAWLHPAPIFRKAVRMGLAEIRAMLFGSAAPPRPLKEVTNQPQLDLEERTLGEALRDGGYATGFVGKWHLGQRPFYPDRQGYDHMVGVTKDQAGSYFAPFSLNRFTNFESGEAGEFLTDRLGDETLRFIERQARASRPFLVFLSTYAAHEPIDSPPDLVEKYRRKLAKGKRWPEPRYVPEIEPIGVRRGTRVMQIQANPVFAAILEIIDRNVGKVLDGLDKLGIAENTVVIFFSDNGGLATYGSALSYHRLPRDLHDTSNAPLRAGKGYLFEGGIRVPMVVRWPGVTKPGSECTLPVISNDFFPTLLDIAGLPAEPEHHRDGVSLASLLKGGNELEREALYWHLPHYGTPGDLPSTAVRMGDLKAIEFLEDGHLEIYNLHEDVGERRNLANQAPEVTASLKRAIREWRRSVGAKMPARNPSFEPAVVPAEE